MLCLITLSKLSKFHWRWWDRIQAIFLNLFYFMWIFLSNHDSTVLNSNILTDFWILNFSLRYTLQVAERERSILWQQHKKKAPMAFFPPKRGATGSARPKTTSKLPPQTASEDDEDTISSSTISLQLESTVTSSVRPENRQNTGKSLSEALLYAELGENILYKKMFWMSKTISVHNMFFPCFELGIVMYWTICCHIVG